MISGDAEFGGPFFADNGAGEDAAERAYGGSFFLMEAESYADALEVVQADVYYKDLEGLVRFDYILFSTSKTDDARVCMGSGTW